MVHPPQPFLRRAQIRNFKSIAKCDVHLRPLTLLVGRNGSGKSNFLDALRFVSDSLKNPLEYALKLWGGIDAVRRISAGHPRNFAIQLEVSLHDDQLATYGFEVSAKKKGGFEVRHERAHVAGRGKGDYSVESGRLVRASEPNMPPVLPDRLYLPNAAGLPVFRATIRSRRWASTT